MTFAVELCTVWIFRRRIKRRRCDMFFRRKLAFGCDVIGWKVLQFGESLVSGIDDLEYFGLL